ncbi:MAG: hypothetical protein LUE95_02135 [Oscillospiraceae bacterium]|nr:hypothetical protein [Oscillospiraceae bacterium]
MKRAALSALMITALLLTGCGGAETEERLERRQAELAAAEEISFTAHITANLGDEAFLCTLACCATQETVMAEVTEPEILAGIRAVLQDGDALLQYDGVELAIGAGLAQSAVNPMTAVPLFFDALRTGYVQRTWSEQGEQGALTAAEIYVSDDYALTMYFEAETLIPVYAVLAADGETLISCEIQSFVSG